MSRLYVSQTNRVIAVDQSLNSTGLAYRRQGEVYAYPIGFDGLRGFERLHRVAKAVMMAINTVQPTLFVIESPAFAAPARRSSNAVMDLGGLYNILAIQALRAGVDVLAVPPTVLKKYVTGKGNAQKKEVEFALNDQYGLQFRTSDQYDAAGLLMIGEAYGDARLRPRDRRHYKHQALQSCQIVNASGFI